MSLIQLMQTFDPRFSRTNASPDPDNLQAYTTHAI